MAPELKLKQAQKHLYANYKPNDFDKYNCLKLPLYFYLLLAFVLRAYLVWLMSVTNMRDHVSFLQWVFPQQQLFYLTLFSGSIGVFVVFLIALRRPDASSWVKSCWKHGRGLITFAILFDLGVNAYANFINKIVSWNVVLIELILAILFISYLFTNNRMKIVFNEFPEAFEKD